MPGPPANPIPEVAITLHGTALPSRAYDDLLEVSVEDHLDGPSAFTLRLAAGTAQTADFAWADDALFNVGTEIEIKLGYSGALTSLLYGDISGLTLELSRDETPSVQVRGYDRRHRMARGGNTRTFTNMKDSDIASQLAGAYGLTAQVVDSRIQHEHVSQERQSDLDFLGRRAAAIGYEVLTEGRVLHFRPRQHGAAASLTLQADRDLLDFTGQLSARQQVSAVEVRGWDPRNKQALIGRAASGDQTSMGPHGGPETARQAFGAASVTLTEHSVSTQEEADRLAREHLERTALAYGQGQGTCTGTPALRAGVVVEVTGVGQRFSGLYYVTSATHTYAPARGYRTAFSGRRNAT